MGLSFDFLVFSNGGVPDLRQPLDVSDAQAFVRRLYPRTAYEHIETARLLEVARQPRGRIAIGVFAGGVLVATKDAHLYDPDTLHRRYLRLKEWTELQLLTSASVSNMFAYGRWQAGEMVRCLSVNPVAGVWRDWGEPSVFEGGQPVSEDRWLELSNAALESSLQLDGDAVSRFPGYVDWEDVVLHVFARPVSPA